MTKKLTARKKAAIRKKRPVHKKILLHPAAIFMLLCTGVLLAGLTLKTHAETFNVQGRVPAPPLTDPAVITNPVDGKHFNNKPINVSGDCPANSYVNLERNGVFAGTALCTSNTFSLSVDLTAGANTLLARVFNITDDEGPAGTPVTVYYDPPVTPVPPVTPPNKPPKTPPPSIAPFVISSNYKYKGYLTGEEITWPITISGGGQPYAFNVKWGDGKESTFIRENGDSFDLTHAYRKAGNYTVKIQASDVYGSSAYLEVFSIVKNGSFVPGIASSIGSGTSISFSYARDWLWLIWPAYLMLILMVISFWLGERQEYVNIFRPNRTAHGHKK